MDADDGSASGRRSTRRSALHAPAAAAVGTSGRHGHYNNMTPRSSKPPRAGVKRAGEKGAGRGGVAPCEVFDTGYVSMMKLSDTDGAAATADKHNVMLPLADQWRTEWSRGVQVPVSEQYADEAPIKRVDCAPAPGGAVRRRPWKRAAGYVRLQKDECYSPSTHHYSDVALRAPDVCTYDCDDADRAWLRLANERRELEGRSPITAEHLERALEWCEWRCAARVERIASDPAAAARVGGARLGREFDDDAACDVCLSREHSAADAIVFCDGCDLAVHQSCYGVASVPDGQWLCRPCRLLRPAARVKCALCPKVGGALSCSVGAETWCHVACALWIPEVYFGDAEAKEPVKGLLSVPPTRLNLRCSVCGERRAGACLQCAERKCTAAYHVTCAQRAGLLMDVVGARLSPVTYCKRHSAARRRSTSDQPSVATSNGYTPPPRASGGLVTPPPPLSPPPTGEGEEEDAVDLETLASPRKRKARRVAKLHAAFYRLITPSEQAECARQLNIPADVVAALAAYWRLRRWRAGGHPLMTTRADEQEAFVAHEDEALVVRVKMLVAMRQNLERARNLSYMVVKRERLKRQHVGLVERLVEHVRDRVDQSAGKLSRREAAQMAALLDSQSYYDDLHESNPHVVDDIARTIWAANGAADPPPDRDRQQPVTPPSAAVDTDGHRTPSPPVVDVFAVELDAEPPPCRNAATANSGRRLCKVSVPISPVRVSPSKLHVAARRRSMIGKHVAHAGVVRNGRPILRSPPRKAAHYGTGAKRSPRVSR